MPSITTQIQDAPIRVGMVNLGCAKNLVDAEVMLGSVVARGMTVTADSQEADVLVINTCAFIDAAKEESIDAILQAHQQRESHRPDQKLIVSGCMSQRYADELRQSLPEVDAFIGLDQVKDLGKIVHELLEKHGSLNNKRRTSSSENSGFPVLGSDEVDLDLTFQRKRRKADKSCQSIPMPYVRAASPPANICSV